MTYRSVPSRAASSAEQDRRESRSARRRREVQDPEKYQASRVLITAISRALTQRHLEAWSPDTDSEEPRRGRHTSCTKVDAGSAPACCSAQVVRERGLVVPMGVRVGNAAVETFSDGGVRGSTGASVPPRRVWWVVMPTRRMHFGVRYRSDDFADLHAVELDEESA